MRYTNRRILDVYLYHCATQPPHCMSADLNVLDVLVNEDDGDGAGVHRQQVVDVHRVETIFLVELVVVDDERNTEHEILGKRQYLHTARHSFTHHSLVSSERILTKGRIACRSFRYYWPA